MHIDNAYYLENVLVENYLCKTNTASNTAFRGFGGNQGMMAIENIIDHIATSLKKDSAEIRRRNFYQKKKKNVTHYNMKIEDNVMQEIFDQLIKSSNYKSRQLRIKKFNSENKYIKKGIALTPVKFGISFTTWHLNQAGALVHIYYNDGSVHVNTGAIEMGQGTYTKIAQLAANALGLPFNKIKVSKWILTDEDLLSDFRIDKFLKFKKSNFNELLGWDKKKNTKNFDRIGNKKISYSIDKKGFRKSKYKNFKNSIITFGDSYVFCRQVTDKDTWQEFISKKNKLFVSNYGVGNYGLDQSYLKFKKTKLNSKTKIILFGFVPETICRIQSIWKNFLEFGNVHGFKPYCLFQKKIYLKNNILKKNTKYNQLKKIVELAKQKDRFFIEKV